MGLRFQHQQAVLDDKPPVAWLEVHAENYMGHSAATQVLEALRADYPISLHGVGLSLGSVGPIDKQHLKRLKALVQRIQPCLVSEHLSWNRIGEYHLPDLLPLPMTDEALAVVCANVERVQHELGRRIIVENPSSYFGYTNSTMSEPEFMSAMVRRTSCGILCDINNIYLSAQNHGWSANEYLAGLPANAVQEYHLAGHAAAQTGRATWLVDDHGSPVPAQVWALFREALRTIGPRPTLIERDNNIPELAELLAEVEVAQEYLLKIRL
ncbi:uncharacterized protein (UPF0276 family) [Pelomonas saccharophila]|uniref:Uncharacterized protein (UPF0276 family) n=1 Tax=Roseateles saccharophilus TaxID=304 RepID=A0ABU1YWH9_ROSSA|nr:DUF692 domain-containing protein [Roseateles saccharophilus]MDR7273213.1 uncharacterized protein (UPF0276 family) [Roseateles saccharophilus]